MTTWESATLSLEERLARLETADELHTLAHEYCHGLDKRDLTRFLAVWAAEGEWVLGEGMCPRGHAEIAATVSDGIWPSFVETHHWTSNHVLDWSGATPRGTCDVSATVHSAEGEWLLASATYVDTYTRVDDRWLISRREATTHFTRPIGS